MPERPCVVCGGELPPDGHGGRPRVVCGDECREEYRRRWYRNRYREDPEAARQRMADWTRRMRATPEGLEHLRARKRREMARWRARKRAEKEALGRMVAEEVLKRIGGA